MNTQDVIDRCTRNGHTAWQQVANQLGRSVDAVRSQYDPQYLRSRPWPQVCEEVPTPDPNDTSSPYSRGPCLRTRVLTALAKHNLSAQTIASMVGTTVGSAKWQLNALKNDGLVNHTDRIPYVWSLKDIRPPNGSMGEFAA